MKRFLILIIITLLIALSTGLAVLSVYLYSDLYSKDSLIASYEDQIDKLSKDIKDLEQTYLPIATKTPADDICKSYSDEKSIFLLNGCDFQMQEDSISIHFATSTKAEKVEVTVVNSIDDNKISKEVFLSDKSDQEYNVYSINFDIADVFSEEVNNYLINFSYIYDGSEKSFRIPVNIQKID